MVFALTSRLMLLLSLGAAGFFYFSQLNAWPLLPTEALAGPAGLLLLSGAAVRLMDPNYPLWNGLLMGFGAPILSCVAVAGGAFMDPGAAK